MTHPCVRQRPNSEFDRHRPFAAERVTGSVQIVYVGAQAVTPIRKGLGINILSTPKGIMVDREAQKAKVGGELICSVW